MLVGIGTFSDVVFARVGGGATARVVGGSTHVSTGSSSTLRIAGKSNLTVVGGCAPASASSGATMRVAGKSSPVRGVVIFQILESRVETMGP